jgi:uncharacterized RDD family membrane protein YckC
MEVISYNRYVGFFKRLIAWIIDLIIINAALGLFSFLTHIHVYDTDDLFSKGTLLSPLITMIYFVVLESSVWQATIGKKILGIKVVDEDYNRVSVLTAFIRYITSYLSAFVLCLGFIWIIFDSRKQGWHDKLAKTFVIEVD